MESDYFCHNNCGGYGLISLDDEFKDIKLESSVANTCLFNGMVVVLSSSLVNSNTLKVKSDKYIHCSCCYMTLGIKRKYDLC